MVWFIISMFAYVSWLGNKFTDLMSAMVFKYTQIY